MELKTIISEKKEEFEEELKKYIKEGYKIINSNISAQRPVQAVYSAILKGTQYDIIYYAIVIKED